MRRAGLRHAELSRLIGLLGHTDTVVIADCGLPIPRDLPMVDLALGHGEIAFRTVLDIMLSEIVVQAHTVADESLDSQVQEWCAERAPHLGEAIMVPHEELKARVAQAAFVVRTGEETPYANVILQCGVPF
ncbi:D-ribose pyranase [Austwickia sp. TVS 96-490-7B]|uniref:D-ribose pyranase n=1 Tax=Austwickia sp. TVS 96-490-7B TaxID=2830843 RepID=UPI001C591FEC|nr:D-ribose pyranase [Austwickia sp. TVS 96-490-7B]MBW3085024.1 D-ribose pyranase [Austwickia sp. TVS 96-490-7B]